MEYLDEVDLYVLNNLRVQGEQAIKNHLAQYSPEVITNSLIRAIRSSDTLGFVDYKNLLLTDHLEINITGLGGDTAIYVATLKNNLWIVKDLIYKGADINVLCVNKSYPLLAACTKPENFELLDFLLKEGANPNLITNSGDTSFTYCARGDSPRSITRMIEAGADMNFRDSNNTTPLQSIMFINKTDNLIALCQGAKDTTQIDTFRCQADELGKDTLAHHILNNIELKMNLDKNLHMKNNIQELKPKI